MTLEEKRDALKQAAADAIQVQDACNLGAVVHTLDRHISTLQAIAHEEGRGTEFVNQHPIVKLFVDKLASLCHMQGDQGFENFPYAWRACHILAGEKPEKTEAEINRRFLKTFNP